MVVGETPQRLTSNTQLCVLLAGLTLEGTLEGNNLFLSRNKKNILNACLTLFPQKQINTELTLEIQRLTLTRQTSYTKNYNYFLPTNI